ncbi:unnamed protein product [Prunus armeniaca]|uniref:Uncharacterized protein n=1 Tax=Prunus armeniaca TaxID=36596 RepID=A0A6J5TVI6_PRUAR|nr:unnamed protein product [Prunus armeniaca]
MPSTVVTSHGDPSLVSSSLPLGDCALYPFLKGLMGRQNRTPTIVIVWSILLASIFSLLWVRVDPFTTRVTGPDVEQCGINC